MPRFNGYEAEGTLLQGTSLFRNLIDQIMELRELLVWIDRNEDLGLDTRQRINEALSDP